ncbi:MULTISPECIES: BrnT family toxin [unclassified Thioalkalivibrio]|uniref:BrnT family toxin n=1 Tax=unclassified Thioalkalivibrio TaxID=2621013 RepID=UPI0009DA09D9|nr:MULTISPECIES: BrnT family toxin [unclassified Thioalkalivibrio]
MHSFEFDERKSRSNLEKHGIDFVTAQALWRDPDLLEVPGRTEDEPRFLVIGRIERRLWTAVVTHREACVRIISVRRSRKEEVALYESEDI